MSKEARIKEGDDILIFIDKKRKILTRAERGKLHTHKGYFDLGEVIGKRFGNRIVSNKGYIAYILKPTLLDYYKKFSRRTQIMYHKDLSYAIVWLGISSGSRILEGGTGSGAATAFLANIVKPSGRVVTYDVNKRSLEIAEENLRRCGLHKYVTLKLGSIYEPIEEESFDAALVDVPEPWLTFSTLENSLKDSARIVFFTPTINQVERIVNKAEDRDILIVDTVEIIERSIRVKEGMTRPETVMIGHTGYLTLAVKVKKRQIK